MTVDELVRSVITGKEVEVFDRKRIAMIFKNVSRGYGLVELNTKNKEVLVTYKSGKSNYIRYHILLEQLDEKQDKILKRKLYVEMG